MSSDFERKVFLENDYSNALQEIEQEISKSSDRGTVLICGSVLEGLLGEIFKEFLIEGNKREEDLFKGKGALGNFDGKIIMAYYLGLINKSEFDNLKHLQKIRNIFAHQVFDISFENNKINNICLNFKIPKNGFVPKNIPIIKKDTDDLPKVDLNPIKKDTKSKDRFLFTFYYLFGCLIRKAAISSVEKRQELSETLTADEYLKDAGERNRKNLEVYRNSLNKIIEDARILNKKLEGLDDFGELSEDSVTLNELKKLIEKGKKEYSEVEKLVGHLNNVNKYVYKVIENSKKD